MMDWIHFTSSAARITSEIQKGNLLLIQLLQLGYVPKDCLRLLTFAWKGFWLSLYKVGYWILNNTESPFKSINPLILSVNKIHNTESLSDFIGQIDGETGVLVQAIMSIKAIIKQNPVCHEKVILFLISSTCMIFLSWLYCCWFDVCVSTIWIANEKRKYEKQKQSLVLVMMNEDFTILILFFWLLTILCCKDNCPVNSQSGHNQGACSTCIDCLDYWRVLHSWSDYS